jgi:hypothetical protein
MDTCQAAHIPIILEEFEEVLERIGEESGIKSSKEFCLDMMQAIGKRYTTTGNHKLFDFISSFTLHGRSRLRKVSDFGQQIFPDEFDDLFKEKVELLTLSPKDRNDWKRYVEDIRPTYETFLTKSTQVKESMMKKFNRMKCKPKLNLFAKYRQVDKADTQSSEEMIESDDFSDIHVYKAMNEIEEHESQRETEEEEQHEVVETNTNEGGIRRVINNKVSDRGLYIDDEYRIASESSDSVGSSDDEIYIDDGGNSLRSLSSDESTGVATRSIKTDQVFPTITSHSNEEISTSDSEQTSENGDAEIESFFDYSFAQLDRLIDSETEMDRSVKQDLHMIYQEWLTSAKEMMNIQHTGKPSDFSLWVYLASKKRWRHLATIAQRVIVIGASEASAERFFSLQESAIGRHRTRTGTKTEEARMTFATSKLNVYDS